MTLLKSATNGWLDYTQHGKYAALLLAAILYLGYCLWKSKAARNGGKQPLFYLYAVLITLACIGLLIAAEWWRRRRLTSPPLDESPEELWDLH